MEDIEYTSEEIAEDAIPHHKRVVDVTSSNADKEFYYQYLLWRFYHDKITLELFNDLVKGYTPVADRPWERRD